MFSANVAILYKFSMSLCIPFQKKSILIKDYVLLYVTACPCKLSALTKIVRTKDLGSKRASNDLSASCVILHSLLSFIMNSFLTEGICSVL